MANLGHRQPLHLSHLAPAGLSYPAAKISKIALLRLTHPSPLPANFASLSITCLTTTYVRLRLNSPTPDSQKGIRNCIKYLRYQIYSFPLASVPKATTVRLFATPRQSNLHRKFSRSRYPSKSPLTARKPINRLRCPRQLRATHPTLRSISNLSRVRH